MLLLIFFSIKAEASLSTHPEMLRDTIYVGNNETSLLHITSSTSTLGYDLSSDAAWISFSSTSGSINAGDTVSITIYYDAVNLQSGINNANIYIGDPHHGPITIPVEVYVQSTTDVKEEYSPNSPASFSLMQNYPNPFNPSTKINYTLPETQKVVIKVYNILGNEIMTLVNGEKSKGSYSLNLDLSDYTSGVYFYAIKTPKYYATKKMILTK
jgi:hypothetical protein